jgi:hypothetical protein
MLERGTAIKAGVALMQALTEQDYIDAMGDKETWCRLYKPGNTGAKMDDEELGYRGVKFWRGKRGEINPNKPRANWNTSDNQDGFLAQNRSRVLYQGQTIDTMALYFMTPDRSEESWSIATAIKDDKARDVRSATETGARNKNDIVIVKSAAKGGATTLKPPILGEGYISQFETMLVPRLIVRHKALVEMGFYCWQDHTGSDSGTISFRKDSLSSQGKLFSLATTRRDAAAAEVSVYNEKGELIRSELPGNMVWEPIELTDLKRLWEQKNLPVGR